MGRMNRGLIVLLSQEERTNELAHKLNIPVGEFTENPKLEKMSRAYAEYYLSHPSKESAKCIMTYDPDRVLKSLNSLLDCYCEVHGGDIYCKDCEFSYLCEAS